MTRLEEDIKLAGHIRDALLSAGGEDVLIMGSIESGEVLIDGNFDLVKVAEFLRSIRASQKLG